MAFAKRIFFAALLFSLTTEARADSAPTPNMYGTLGLNTVPSARMDPAGTMRLNLGLADPYLHTQLGFQVNERLYVGLRQSGEVSSLKGDPKHVFPGLDLKFKLFEEKSLRPEISLGLQSAFGHKRMAGEYLAFSKRYENFDFTGGFGWGRYGGRNKIPNPFDWTGSYLSEDRNPDGEKPNSPKDWFTGDTGFFAGIEYQTSIEGVSLKADWSADSYRAEKTLGLKTPSAYSFGVTYQPVSWLDAGVAYMGNNTVMARLSLKSQVANWPFSRAATEDLIPLRPDPVDKNIIAEAKNHGLVIRKILPDDKGMSGQLYINDAQSTPHQLSQAWRIVTNKTAAENPNILRLEPIYFGLRGPAISISRRDLQDAGRNSGSAEEIWRHMSYDSDLTSASKKIEKFIPFVTLEENMSMSEDDGGIYHRTSFLGTLTHQLSTYLLSETSLRYILFSNLSRLENLRPPSSDPVRSDEYYYNQRRVSLNRGYVQGFKSFTPDLHISASAGYLEEMFAGYHGEILYRPFAKNWALGAEISDVMKRNYETAFNLGLFDQSRLTGHLNFYYEIPDSSMTFHASVGRYLAGDKGASLSLVNKFRNGATLEALITATDMSDEDAYGGSANIYSGFKFSLPLGSLKYIPTGSGIDLNVLPVARDAGQRLDIAHPLYDMTEPLSYRHLVENWGDVTTAKPE